MSHLLLQHILTLCLALVIGHQGQAERQSATADAQEPAVTVVSPTHRDRLNDANARKHQPHEATLTDATGASRVCSSRPQRLLPTNGSNPEKTSGRLPTYLCRTPKKQYFVWKQRTETAPFPSTASQLYYVIALRHIIR